jgi:pimeloyl-ACP methyl ester carboxylesterase
MKELAGLHGTTNVVYAGHSAGGLAAIIAAAQDNTAVGVLGLDATDTQDVPGVDDFIGREYAGDVSCPSFSIMGEPSSCNSDNNGLELFKMMPEYRAIQVTSADHCDFENPTDFVCEVSCEASTAEYSDEEIRPVIISLTTAAMASLTGISEDGALVWAEEGLSGWMEAGLIQEK